VGRDSRPSLRSGRLGGRGRLREDVASATLLGFVAVRRLDGPRAGPIVHWLEFPAAKQQVRLLDLVEIVSDDLD